jgi:hypothetical protein
MPEPAADSGQHRAASRIANRIVVLLHRTLRPGEHEYAVQSIYRLAREEIEAMDHQPALHHDHSGPRSRHHA